MMEFMQTMLVTDQAQYNIEYFNKKKWVIISLKQNILDKVILRCIPQKQYLYFLFLYLYGISCATT